MKQRTIYRKGKNVNLVLIQPEDAELITEWINDVEINEFLNQSYPISLEMEKEWIEKTNKDKTNIVFGIETKDNQLIGVIGIHRINHINQTASTGAYIGVKEYWGKGLGSEAKLILLDYAFNTLNLRKICSSCIENNERSLKYQKKTGGIIEGVRKDQHFKKGKYYDEILLAVYKENWLPFWLEYNKK